MRKTVGRRQNIIQIRQDFMFLTNQPIQLEKFLTQKPDPSCGAVASFVGVVRNHHEEKLVKRIYYECYRPMAEKQIQEIIERIKKESGVHDIRVQHRIGWLEVSETAVVIVVTAAHREAAFSACRAVIEGIKQKVPIWKKEVYTDNASQWVSQCQSMESS